MMAIDSGSRSPIREIDVVMTKDARDSFLSWLKLFGERQQFTVKQAHESPFPKYLLIQMTRPDAQVLSTDGSDTDAKDILFKNWIYAGADRQISPGALEKLTSEFKADVLKISGVTAVDIR